MKQVNGQMSMFDLDMPCGKMFPVHTAAIKARTSASSLRNSAALKTVTPMFLDLRAGSGLTQERSWVTGIPSHGERSTLNFGECPKDVVASTLSQILENNVPLKYYLSERACEGVLRRAERRGKPLDEILRKALEQQIERWEKFGTPLPIAELNVTDVLSVENHAQDERYTLHGDKVQTLSAKMGKGGDNVPYVLYVSNSSRRDIAATLDASYYKGAGNRSGKERELVCEKVIALDRAAFNQGINARYDMGISEDGKAFTLTARGPGAVCYEQETQYVVRRLTPLECCRLQGMPDWWEEDIDGADSARYKMWGNGMALPNALYVMEGLIPSIVADYFQKLVELEPYSPHNFKPNGNPSDYARRFEAGYVPKRRKMRGQCIQRSMFDMPEMRKEVEK